MIIKHDGKLIVDYEADGDDDRECVEEITQVADVSYMFSAILTITLHYFIKTLLDETQNSRLFSVADPC